MNRNSNFLAVHHLTLYLAIVFLSAGCGKLRTFEQKIEQKVDHRPPGHLHSVTISWTASTSHVVGYNVYRTTSPGNSVEKLTPQPIAGTQFTDTTAVGGVSYNYYATSVDSRGIEGVPSALTPASIPYP